MQTSNKSFWDDKKKSVKDKVIGVKTRIVLGININIFEVIRDVKETLIKKIVESQIHATNSDVTSEFARDKIGSLESTTGQWQLFLYIKKSVIYLSDNNFYILITQKLTNYAGFKAKYFNFLKETNFFFKIMS